MRVATRADKALIEAIVHHPAVRPHVLPAGAVFDATPYLSPPHVALVAEGGCFLGAAHGGGRYEAHTNFVPSGRGRNALRQMHLALMYMFLRTDCQTIVTQVPIANMAADWATRCVGFRFLFEAPRVWPGEAQARMTRYYEHTIDDWILTGVLAEGGRIFHQQLHEALPQAEHHVEDQVHDAYVGALASMVLVGNVQKAIAVYNRWALFAGYARITQVSDHPLCIDARDFVVRFENGNLAVEGK
jgi:hypothetical protein